MRRTANILMAFIIVFCFHSQALAAPPSTAAKGAVLMEVETGRVLYQKNPNIKMPMASTTKIMTAIVAIEKGNLSDMVTISPNAAGVEGSSIYLAKGQQIKLEDLLYGLMLRSGNDAAVAVAEHVGGSVKEFAKMMNEKAIEIGAKNTHFVNPHGLHNWDHYTTAYDLALISAYAMRNPTFKTIVSTKSKKIPWRDQSKSMVMTNKNSILWSYKGGNGIKTGYTTVSKRCLVSAAFRDNMQLVCVVLNCRPWFEDSMKLLDYGFNEFKAHLVFEKGQKLGEIMVEKGHKDSVNMIIDDDVVLPLRDGEKDKVDIKITAPTVLTAPLKAGTKIGCVEVRFKNEIIIKRDLFIDTDIEENTFKANLKREIDKWIDRIKGLIPGAHLKNSGYPERTFEE